MNKKLKFSLNVVLVLVFLFSITMVLRQMQDNSGGGSSYDDALQIALSGNSEARLSDQANPSEHTSPTEPEEPQETKLWIPAPVEDTDPHVQTLEAISLEALRQVNPDVIGWIMIPDTKINYPLLQGEDNDFYLEHTWEGKKNSVGSIFLEHRNTPDFTDFNTIVYGHNMNSGAMFGSLSSYGSHWHWERHPYIYIRTEDGVFRYEVFSSYRAEVTGSAYGLSFHQPETRATFLVNALENSRIDTGVEPALTDRILTLSTCSGAGYSTRWVVHARLKMIQTDSLP